MATTLTTSETVCRDFARQYPTPHVRRAIAHAEAGAVTWAQVEGLFAKALEAGLAEVWPK